MRVDTFDMHVDALYMRVLCLYVFYMCFDMFHMRFRVFVFAFHLFLTVPPEIPTASPLNGIFHYSWVCKPVNDARPWPR